MPIPNTLARKITADFRAEKKYGGRKNFCDALGLIMASCVKHCYKCHVLFCFIYH